MTLSEKRWRKLFLFCLGLSVSAAFCMKWIETDFLIGDQSFTMIGLELSYSKEKIIGILSGLDDQVKTILSYHLHFDFIFMAGIFPGIAALCMMAREKVTAAVIRKSLFILACLQLPAWAFDIRENLYLLDWTKNPAIGNEFGFYHFIVGAKWIIALIGALFSGFILLTNRKRKSNLIS